MDEDLEFLRELGPEAQAEAELRDRRRLAALPPFERLRIVMEQVRAQQAIQERTLTPAQKRRRWEAEVAEARRVWGDDIP